jgi:hypothetical protein
MRVTPGPEPQCLETITVPKGLTFKLINALAKREETNEPKRP